MANFRSALRFIVSPIYGDLDRPDLVTGYGVWDTVLGEWVLPVVPSRPSARTEASAKEWLDQVREKWRSITERLVGPRSTRGDRADAETALYEWVRTEGWRFRPNPSRGHLGASVWSRELYGSAATAFSNLKPGDQFRFPEPKRGSKRDSLDRAMTLYTKVNATRYVDVMGRNFTTGRHAAVIPMRERGNPKKSSNRYVVEYTGDNVWVVVDTKSRGPETHVSWHGSQAQARAACEAMSLRDRSSRKNPIDYDRAKREAPALRAALTRALNSGDPSAVRNACRKAVKAWDAWGAWPDDWRLWQSALDRVHPLGRRVSLSDLESRDNPCRDRWSRR